MKKNYIIKLTVLVLLVSAIGANAQTENVGIGTTAPDESAVLDIQSSSKGLLIPRMFLSERNQIVNPAKGLLIYQTNENQGFYFFNGKDWAELSPNEAKSIAADPNDWTTSGNSNITTTSPGNSLGTTNFIGTTNAAPIVFKTTASGRLSGFISPTNTNVSFGYRAMEKLGSGTSFTGVFNTAIGTEAMFANTTGSNNVSIGMKSLYVNTTGLNNVAIGTQALTANIGGSGNLAFGYQSMRSNTGGNNNLALGLWSLRDNSTGSTNVGIGYGALAKNTSGTGNTGIGANTLQANLTGTDNTAFGLNAGYSAIGSGSVFLGRSAGYNEVGSNKLYVANSPDANPLIKGDFADKNLRINVGANNGTANNATTTGYMAIGNFDAETPMAIPSGYRLVVESGILTEKIKVALKSSTVGADWADYVFEPDYKLMSLEEVENFTKENKHLPNVPSADEMVASGLDVAQTSKMFMEKIEELTLYMIELNKEVKALKAENEVLKAKLK